MFKFYFLFLVLFNMKILISCVVIIILLVFLIYKSNLKVRRWRVFLENIALEKFPEDLLGEE